MYPRMICFEYPKRVLWRLQITTTRPWHDSATCSKQTRRKLSNLSSQHAAGLQESGGYASKLTTQKIDAISMGAEFFGDFFFLVLGILFFFGRGHGFLTFSLFSMTFPWFFIGFPSFFLTFSSFSSIFLWFFIIFLSFSSFSITFPWFFIMFLTFSSFSIIFS